MIFEISQTWKEAEDLRNDFITMWSIFKDYNDGNQINKINCLFVININADLI